MIILDHHPFSNFETWQSLSYSVTELTTIGSIYVARYASSPAASAHWYRYLNSRKKDQCTRRNMQKDWT